MNQIWAYFRGGVDTHVETKCSHFPASIKNMTNKNNNIDPKIIRIRKLAGQIGASVKLENSSDSENYGFQVLSGLADAAVEILEYNPCDLIDFFGACLENLGVNPKSRIGFFLCALHDEVHDQLDEEVA